jgi:WD40 repeat protein
MIASGDTKGVIRTWHLIEREGADMQLYSAKTKIGRKRRISSLSVRKRAQGSFSSSNLLYCSTGTERDEDAMTEAVRDSLVGHIRIAQTGGKFVHLPRVMHGHQCAVISVAFHPTNDAIAISTDICGGVKWWNMPTEECRATIQTRSNKKVTFTPDGKGTVVWGIDGDDYVAIWPIVHPRRELVHEDSVHDLIANKTTVASLSRDNIMLWNNRGHGYALLEAAQRPPLPSALNDCTGEHRVHSLAFGVVTLSRCSKWVAGGGDRGHIAVWTLQEMDENTTTRFYANHIITTDPQGKIRALAFSPDNALLVSGAANQVIQVWDTREGTSIWRIQAKELSDYRLRTEVSFQSNNSFLLIGTERDGGAWKVARRWKGGFETATWAETDWRENVGSDEMGDEERSAPEEPDLQWTSNGRILSAREKGDEDVHPTPRAIYFHNEIITAILERDGRVIIGDKQGGVTFLKPRNLDILQTASGGGYTTGIENVDTETPILVKNGGIQTLPQALTPTRAFAEAPRFRVWACLPFETGNKLFDIEVIRHSDYTVLDFKKSVIQQLDIDPSVVTPRDWRVLLSGKQLEDHKTLCSYGVRQDSTLDIEIRLRGGGGKKKPTKESNNQTEESTVTATFRALAIQRRQQERAAEAEEDMRAGAVMGEGEEHRKEEAKKEHEKRKAIAKGLKREATARQNAKVSDSLEEIQQALQRLPILPEQVDVTKIRHLLKTLNLSTEMVEIFCRVWLHTEALETTPAKIAKRMAPGTIFRPDGTRFRIYLEGVDKGQTVNQSQMEDWIRKHGPSRFTMESMQTVTEARNELRQTIVSPASWRLAFETIPPSMLEALRKDIKLIIQGKEFYYYCEGPNELELEVMWDNEDQARLLFMAMDALDLSDTHMELLLTHFVRQSLDDAQINPEAARAQLSQQVATMHFWDGMIRHSKWVRLSPRARAADNNRLLWPKLNLYAVSPEGHRLLSEISLKCTLSIPYGLRPGLSPATCQFSLRPPAIRALTGTPLQKAIGTLIEMRTQAISTTETYCHQAQNTFDNFKSQGKIGRDEMESLHLYLASACTSVENLSHKVTRKTAALLREMVNTVQHYLANSDMEIDGDKADHILTLDMWEKIRASLTEEKKEPFMLFWAKGSTWTDIDAQILAEIRKGTSTWPRDRQERAKKAFRGLGASGVTAALEKSTLQYMVFECEEDKGNEIMTTCTGVKEYKQGGSMVSGGTLSLEHLHLPYLLSPTIHITWRNLTNMESVVDDTTVKAAIMRHLEAAEGIWLHKHDSFGAQISDEAQQNRYSTTTNAELAPTPSGVEWINMGQATLEGNEISSDEFGEAIATAVQQGTAVSPTLLRTLPIPPINAASFIMKDGHSFRPIPATREKFSAHLAHLGKLLGLGDIPATAILRLLGALRRDKKVGYVSINQSYGIYIAHRIIQDLGRESLPHEILSTPGQPIFILPALKTNCKDYLLNLIGEGGLWIRGMLPALEETSPRIAHSMSSMNDMVGEILIELRQSQEVVHLDMTDHTLLLPKGKIGTLLGTWPCKEPFGTKLRHSSFPPPKPEVAKEIWEQLYSAASEKGFMLIPLIGGTPGESKTEKLNRGLTSLSDPVIREFTQAGWPTLLRLVPGENLQLYGSDSWLAPFFRPNVTFPIEILPVILKGRGEALLVWVGRKDLKDVYHSPMDMYGVLNKRDWVDLSAPADVTTRMDQKALVVLVDKIARITRERGHCLLLGWTIQAEPSLMGANAFTKAASRWDGTNSLSPITLPSAVAWVEREGAIYPTTVLLQAVASAVMEGTVRGCMVRVGTLLMTPEGDMDDTIQILRPKNPLSIADLRQADIGWSTTDIAHRDIQSWVNKVTSGKDGSQHALRTGKRAANSDGSSSEVDTMDDDTRMDASPEETGASSSLGGSPVEIERPAAKTPRS